MASAAAGWWTYIADVVCSKLSQTVTNTIYCRNGGVASLTTATGIYGFLGLSETFIKAICVVFHLQIKWLLSVAIYHDIYMVNFCFVFTANLFKSLITTAFLSFQPSLLFFYFHFTRIFLVSLCDCWRLTNVRWTSAGKVMTNTKLAEI